MHTIAKGKVVEHVLYAGLAIIKVAIHCHRVNIGLGRRRHLAALHVTDPAMRVKNEHIDIGQPPERLDRG